MYDYRPTRTNANAKIAVMLLMAAAVIAFAGSGLVRKYPFILQCIGLCLLIPVIQITARYLILQYLYRLRTYDDGSIDLEVYTYRGGSRMQLVCRVGLDEITAAAPLSDANRRVPKGLRRYNYHPDMKPGEGIVLSITNGDGDCELLLAPDAYLREVLEGAAKRTVQEQ